MPQLEDPKSYGLADDCLSAWGYATVANWGPRPIQMNFWATFAIDRRRSIFGNQSNASLGRAPRDFAFRAIDDCILRMAHACVIGR